MITHHAALMAAAVTIVGVPAWYALDRRPPITITDVEVLTPEVEQGGVFIWQVTLDRHRECSFERSSLLIDGGNYVRRDLPVRLASAGIVEDDDVRVFSEPIPSGAVPGEAEYYRWGEYVCNPLQRWWPVRISLTNVADGGDKPLKFTIVGKDTNE